MAVACKFERSVLSHEEWTVVQRTHHPAILDHDRVAILDMLATVRAMRDKECTLAFQRRRESRGKAAPRGENFPGTSQRPLERKQAFSAAVKRLNKEIARIDAIEARSELTRAAHRALAMRRAALRDLVRPLDMTAGSGMSVNANGKARSGVQGSRIGQTTSATKRAQARRDSRG